MEYTRAHLSTAVNYSIFLRKIKFASGFYFEKLKMMHSLGHGNFKKYYLPLHSFSILFRKKLFVGTPLNTAIRYSAAGRELKHFHSDESYLVLEPETP